MAANPGGSQLIAVDSNVLFDLAAGQVDVMDSVSRGDLISKRQHAEKAIETARSLQIIPANLISVHTGISARVAGRIREVQLLPDEEVHDSLIVAESALLGCSILLTSDEHLRGIDFKRLTFELQAFDLSAPVIATPMEIVRKFFR